MFQRYLNWGIILKIMLKSDRTKLDEKVDSLHIPNSLVSKLFSNQLGLLQIHFLENVPFPAREHVSFDF